MLFTKLFWCFQMVYWNLAISSLYCVYLNLLKSYFLQSPWMKLKGCWHPGFWAEQRKESNATHYTPPYTGYPGNRRREKSDCLSVTTHLLLNAHELYFGESFLEFNQTVLSLKKTLDADPSQTLSVSPYLSFSHSFIFSGYWEFQRVLKWT